MLFKEIIDIYSSYTLCGQNAKLLVFETGGANTNHSALKRDVMKPEAYRSNI
jgi:hypothetical protein